MLLRNLAAALFILKIKWFCASFIIYNLSLHKLSELLLKIYFTICFLFLQKLQRQDYYQLQIILVRNFKNFFF